MEEKAKELLSRFADALEREDDFNVTRYDDGSIAWSGPLLAYVDLSEIPHIILDVDENGSTFVVLRHEPEEEE